MALFRFIRLFREAAEFVKSDRDIVDPSRVEPVPHTPYHRRIVAVGIVCTIGAGVLGTIGLVLEGAPSGRTEDLRTWAAFPLVFAAMSMFFGVSVSCLFAPRAFLTSPAGRKWLRLIGTENILVARAVCLALMLIGCAAIGLMSPSFFK